MTCPQVQEVLQSHHQLYIASYTKSQGSHLGLLAIITNIFSSFLMSQLDCFLAPSPHILSRLPLGLLHYLLLSLPFITQLYTYSLYHHLICLMTPSLINDSQYAACGMSYLWLMVFDYFLSHSIPRTCILAFRIGAEQSGIQSVL